MSRKRVLWALGGVGTIMVVWALLAPPERQLGEGIRLVYLHVSLTWAGMIGIYCAGIMGLRMAVFPARAPDAWPRSVGTAGLILFSTGFLLSMASARVSWGGILWEEPRLLASVGIVALGGVVLWMTRGGLDARWKGVAWVVLAGVTAWSLQVAPLFFHPDEPISTSPSNQIRGTFYGLFALAVVLAGLLIVLIFPNAGSEADPAVALEVDPTADPTAVPAADPEAEAEADPEA